MREIKRSSIDAHLYSNADSRLTRLRQTSNQQNLWERTWRVIKSFFMKQFICRLKFRLKRQQALRDKIDWWNRRKLSLEVERPPTVVVHSTMNERKKAFFKARHETIFHGILVLILFYFIAWRRRLITQKRLPMLFVMNSPIATKTFFSSFHHNDEILSILIRQSFGKQSNECCFVRRDVVAWDLNRFDARRGRRMTGVYQELINGKSLATHCDVYAPPKHFVLVKMMTWDLLVQVASRLTALFTRILEYRKFLFFLCDWRWWCNNRIRGK